jgi:8-oxo-dGTP pyrophosphatase MutT (NUDIX family)
MKMAPSPRPGQKVYTEVEATSLKAGVMILLYDRGGAVHVVFIRRPSTVLHHKDQVSFPGGRIEAGEDPVRAALRETWEEIGVPFYAFGPHKIWGATAMVLAEFLDVLGPERSGR